MTTNVATLVNLAGFITGALLYAMLLVMVLGASRITYVTGSESGEVPSRPARLPLLTALLGLAWTFGAFMAYALPNFGIEHSYPIVIALAFTALGFLPAVVVHSTLSGVHTAKQPKGAFGMVFLAYALSALAGFMHIFQALVSKTILSHVALHILTVGFGVLIVGLLLLTRDQPGGRRAMWVIALSVFAVSAQHLSHHQSSNYPWWIELVGHHASLPLALAILYQDYRFALADIFLKRALALILLVALTLGVYATIAPLLSLTDENGEANPQAIGWLLVMWVATVLLYPALRRAVARFVDAKILRRANHTQLRAEIAHLITLHDAPETILNEVCTRLAPALTAREVRWLSPGELDGQSISENGSQPLLPIIEHPPTAQNFLTTAFDEYAVRAFELNAVDYVLKPVEAGRLRKTIDRAHERLEKASLRRSEADHIRAAAADYEATARPPYLERIPVRRRDEILLLPITEIISIVADGGLLHIDTVKNERYTICYRLKDLESRLDPSHFVRLGRGTLVNIGMIKHFTPMPGGTYLATLTNNQKLKVSRLQSRILRDQLLRL